MKRFFIIASMAVLAVGCQKTEIQNEVQNQIGFSTETGKLTRAIVQNNPNDPTANVTYPTDQPFGVYAYGWQKESDGSQVTGGAAGALVMDNVEVSYTEATANTAAKWAVNSGTKYYWPNDPRTTLNFYAFSPYIQRPDNNATTDVNEASQAASKAGVADKVMTVTSLTHSEDDGLQFTGYVHSNMYVDFMEATPVLNATYSDSNGTATETSSAGVVPMTFNHKMTQILFKVTTDKVYDGITFTVESITLNNIKNTANYDDGDWNPSGSASYTIFPANTANGAVSTNTLNAADVVETTEIDESKFEKEIALGSAQGQVANMTTTGVTMIPQDLVAAGQSFTIVYRIAGTGVASETVSKTVDLAVTGGVNKWNNNKKITYTVKIGLNEITFEPSVATWVDEPAANATEAEKEKYEYTFQQ